MLRASLRFQDLGAPATIGRQVIEFGKSRIEPFCHSLLRTRIVASSGAITILVHERLDGDEEPFFVAEQLQAPNTHADWRKSISLFPLDFIALIIDNAERQVEIKTSRWGSSTLYYKVDSEKLEISWNIDELLADRALNLSRREVALFLARQKRFDACTLVEDVGRIPPDTTVRFDSKRGAVFSYPAPWAGVRAHHVAPSVDPSAVLFDAVAATLGVRPLRTDQTALEISGGMDSAVVALAAREAIGPGLRSYGVVFDGPMGEAQSARRAKVVSAAQALDFPVPCHMVLPYRDGGKRSGPWAAYPEEENYPDIFNAIYSFCAEAGVTCIVSGTGGDELMPLFEGEAELDCVVLAPISSRIPFATPALEAATQSERDSSYPVTPTSQSASAGVASRSKALMLRGIWPVNPFLSPEIIDWAAKLPHSFRRGRSLHKAILASRVPNANFHTEYHKETFMPYYLDGVRRHKEALAKLIANGQSSKAGLIDAGAALSVFDEALSTGGRDAANSLFHLINFECFCRDRDVKIQ